MENNQLTVARFLHYAAWAPEGEEPMAVCVQAWEAFKELMAEHGKPIPDNFTWSDYTQFKIDI